jgi:hypothetical protein
MSIFIVLFILIIMFIITYKDVELQFTSFEKKLSFLNCYDNLYNLENIMEILIYIFFQFLFLMILLLLLILLHF